MTTINTYEAEASKLFDKLQRIVEDHRLPLLKFYPLDFYELDRDKLAKTFSEKSRFPWMIHPSGTHLGRVGVLPDEKEWMQAALNTYGNAEGVEIYGITVNEHCDARVKAMTLSEAEKFLAKKDCTIKGDDLYKRSRSISHIEIQNNGKDATVHVTTNGDFKLNREELIAIKMTADHLFEKQNQTLFCEINDIHVNHEDMDKLLPTLKMDEVTIGKYCPEPGLAATKAIRLKKSNDLSM